MRIIGTSHSTLTFYLMLYYTVISNASPACCSNSTLAPLITHYPSALLRRPNPLPSSTGKQGLYKYERYSVNCTTGWSQNGAQTFLGEYSSFICASIQQSKEQNITKKPHTENGMVQGIGNVISLIHLGSVVIESHHYLAAV